MLPDYITKTVPKPKATRAPWYANTAPTYAGVFLWIGFYESIASGTLDRAGWASRCSPCREPRF
jgi:cytosine permease